MFILYSYYLLQTVWLENVLIIWIWGEGVEGGVYQLILFTATTQQQQQQVTTTILVNLQ